MNLELQQRSVEYARLLLNNELKFSYDLFQYKLLWVYYLNRYGLLERMPAMEHSSLAVSALEESQDENTPLKSGDAADLLGNLGFDFKPFSN